MSGLDVEMGVQEKMPVEDQHGGCSHPTSHNCSTDPLTPSGTSTTDYMTSLVGIRARQQVLVSITLPPSSRIPPRSGCLAVSGDRAVLWPKQAGDPVHRLEGPFLVVSWTDNQALVEGAAVCGCGWADMVILSLFGTQAAERRQQGQEGEEHAQEGESVVALGKIEIADGSEHGTNLNICEGYND